MKKFLALIFFVAVIFGIWWLFFKSTPKSNFVKDEPLKINNHSAIFNQSVNAALEGYFDLKTAFVNADSSSAKAAVQKFISLLDSIKIDELKIDTSVIYQSAQGQVGDMKSNADAMLQEPNLTEMRQDFRMISENLYPFLKTIKYEGQKLYWQNCPMAFGEDKEASWISNTKEIINPYLGKNNPEYKATMLHCGEIKDTIQ